MDFAGCRPARIPGIIGFFPQVKQKIKGIGLFVIAVQSYNPAGSSFIAGSRIDKSIRTYGKRPATISIGGTRKWIKLAGIGFFIRKSSGCYRGGNGGHALVV